jgi:hypothetical protein
LYPVAPITVFVKAKTALETEALQRRLQGFGHGFRRKNRDELAFGLVSEGWPNGSKEAFSVHNAGNCCLQ